MIRVLVVDDHPLIREALTDLLAATDDIAVVGQCVDGSEVAAAVAEARPDVLLLDVQMPNVDGLTAARAVRSTHPEVRIVFLTGGLTRASAHEAQEIGVAGHLLKDDDPAELPARIRSVAAGGTAWHPRPAALLDDTQRAVDPPLSEPVALRRGVPATPTSSAVAGHSQAGCPPSRPSPPSTSCPRRVLTMSGSPDAAEVRVPAPVRNPRSEQG